MSGCDRMATPLRTLELSFAICLFIAKQYLSYYFLYYCYVVFIKVLFLFIFIFYFFLFLLF
jgi:hypothetical protein